MARSKMIFCTLALAVLPAVAWAQGQAPAAGRGGSNEIPAAEVNDQTAPPVEITTGIVDGKAQCEPRDLRIPAGRAVDVRLVNSSEHPFTLAGPKLFDGPSTIRFEGDVAHAASGGGFVVKAKGTARIVLKSPEPGDYPFTCTATNLADQPFRGTITAVGG